MRPYEVRALLVSWGPLLGDAPCVASGWRRQPVARVAPAIALGKFAQYYVLAQGGLHFTR